MTECVDCVKYYDCKFCAGCGNKINNLDNLDFKIDMDCWCIFLTDYEHMINQKIIDTNPYGGENNIVANYFSNTLKINSTNLFNGVGLYPLPTNIIKKDTSLRDLLNSLLGDKKIKLFDIVTIYLVGANLVYKFEQSPKLNIISNKINSICESIDSLYFTKSSLFTCLEIEEKYKLEFEMFDINISDLFVYDTTINGIKRYQCSSLLHTFNTLKYERENKYYIFKDLKLKKNPNEVMMKMMGFTQL